MGGVGGGGYIYVVPTTRTYAYAAALEAPVIGVSPSGGGSTSGIAAVPSSVKKNGDVMVLPWSRLNDASPESVYVIVDYGQTGRVTNGAPFEMVMRQPTRLQYAGPDPRNPSHLWTADMRVGVRLARPASIIQVDKA